MSRLREQDSSTARLFTVLFSIVQKLNNPILNNSKKPRAARALFGAAQAGQVCAEGLYRQHNKQPPD